MLIEPFKDFAFQNLSSEVINKCDLDSAFVFFNVAKLYFYYKGDTKVISYKELRSESNRISTYKFNKSLVVLAGNGYIGRTEDGNIKVNGKVIERIYAN